MTIVAIVKFLFAGIGATLIGVFLPSWLRKKKTREYKVSPKTTIRSQEAHDPIVFPLKKNENGPSADQYFTDVNLPTFELQPKAESNITGNLCEYLDKNCGFDTDLASLAVFNDKSQVINTKNDDRIVFADKLNGFFLSSEQNADVWNEINFTKSPKGFSIEKKRDLDTGSHLPSFDSINYANLFDSTIEAGIKNINSAESNIFNLPQLNNDEVGILDRMIYADSDDGVLISSIHDPSKWEEVSFVKTEDTITYKMKKKK